MQTKTIHNAASRRTSPNTSRARIRLLDSRLLLVLLVGLLAGALAYQAPFATDVSVGWLGDQLFLPASEGQSAADSGFWYGDELTPDATGGRSRWTRGDATILLPGTDASGSVSVLLRVQGWPEDVLGGARQPTVDVLANGAPVYSFEPEPGWRDFRFTVPAEHAVGRDLRLVIHASETFTSTARHADARPKGVRVEQLGINGIQPASFVAPVFAPVAWLVVVGALLFWVLLLVVRWPNSMFIVTTLLVCMLGVSLALQRAWIVAVLPWLALALALLLLALLWRAVLGLFRMMVARFLRGRALDRGLIGALWVWLGYLVVRMLVVAVQGPWSRSWPLLLALVLLAVGLWAVRRWQRWPAVLGGFQRAAAWLGTARGSVLALAIFAVLWLGYEAVIIAWYPVVGHADYADNAVVARNLIHGRGWVVDYLTQFYSLPTGVSHPQNTWPLLQPVWIAPFLAVFGVHAWAAKLPNLIFMAMLIVLIYRAGARIWDRRVGLVAAIILATNLYFFYLVLYTTTDLAFTVFAFGAIYLLFLAYQPQGAAPVVPLLPRFGALRLLRTARAQVLGSAVLTGLMLLQKPGSGGLIALGMGLWLLAQYWRTFAGPATRRTLLRHFRLALLWGGLAVLLLLPYLARNIALFHKPLASTESYDAWVLSYTDWDDIYKIYTPAANLSETGGLPERSWLLRWGFDRVLLKLATQTGAVRDYLLPPWDDLPLHLSDLASGGGVFFGVGAWLGLLGFVAALRSRRRILALLLAAFTPYTIFLCTYWHADEQRYFVVLMPWLALLAAYALWQVYDHIATWGDGRWTPAAALLVACALVLVIQPSWSRMARKVQNEPRLLAADLNAYQWVRANTPPGTVVMTRLPWQFNWAADRPALMVPNTADRIRFLSLARYYRARYYVQDSLQNPSPQSQQIIKNLAADPANGLQEVYVSPPFQALDDRGNTITLRTEVYRFAENYGGAGELMP